MTLDPRVVTVQPPPNAINLADPLTAGLGTKWQQWGVGTSILNPLGFSVYPSSEVANSYGGFTTVDPVNLTARYCAVFMPQAMNRIAGNIQTLQLAVSLAGAPDTSNLLELGLVDDRLMARLNQAGTLTTLSSSAWPNTPSGFWICIAESGFGQIQFFYAATNAPYKWSWQWITNINSLPFPVTSMFVTLVAGTYVPVTSPGGGIWNSLNSFILPSPIDTSPALVSPQTSSQAVFSVTAPWLFAGSTVAQASFDVALGQPFNSKPLVSGQVLAQASATGTFALVTQSLPATPVSTQASSSATLRLGLSAQTVAKAAPTGTLTAGPSMSGLVTAQAKATVTQLNYGLVFLPGVNTISLASTLCQTLVLTRYPLSGATIGQGSSTTLLGQSNAVIAPMGILAAGTYAVKTCCRSDVTGVPAALVFAITVAGSVVITVPLYTAGDTVSTTYPTNYANYAAAASFSVSVASPVVFQWSNPGSYHAPGKHVWVKGVQLHRLS